MNEPNPTCMSDATLAEAAAGHLALPDTDCWLSGGHYHCKRCGQEVEYLTRIPWADPKYGVYAMGICKRCRLVMLEFEQMPARWVELEEKMEPIVGPIP